MQTSYFNTAQVPNLFDPCLSIKPFERRNVNSLSTVLNAICRRSDKDLAVCVNMYIITLFFVINTYLLSCDNVAFI